LTPPLSAAAAAQRIAQLELQLKEKQTKIERLQDTISNWDKEKANQFNKIKELFENENNELRRELEAQKKENREREELYSNQINNLKKQHMAEMAVYKGIHSKVYNGLASCTPEWIFMIDRMFPSLY